ncbi:hypothetical protein ACVGWX_16700, partial [Enterobacter hormaechei]
PPPPFLHPEDGIPHIPLCLVGSDIFIRDRELPKDDIIWEQELKAITAEERMNMVQAKVAKIRALVAKAKEKV